MTDSSPSDPAAGDSPALEKEEVLAALDWELSTVADQQKLLGATAWTLLASLGAAAWLLTAETHPWSELPTAACLFLGLSLVQDLIDSVYSVLNRPSFLGPTVSFFQPVSRRFGSYRAEFAFQLFRWFILLACLKFTPARLPHLLLVAITVVLGLRALAAIVGILATQTSWLMRNTTETPPRLKKVLHRRAAILLVFLLVVPVMALPVLFWWYFLRTEPVIPSEALRAAVLTTVSSFLIGRLLVVLRSAPLQEYLLSLRRGVAVGIVSPADALSQLRIATIGFSGEEVVQSEIGALLGSFTALSEKLSEAVGWLDDRMREFKAKGHWADGEWDKAREKLVDGFDRQSETLNQALTSHMRAQLKLQQRFGILYGDDVTRHFKQVTDQHFGRIKAQVDELHAKRDACAAALREARTPSDGGSPDRSR